MPRNPVNYKDTNNDKQESLYFKDSKKMQLFIMQTEFVWYWKVQQSVEA